MEVRYFHAMVRKDNIALINELSAFEGQVVRKVTFKSNETLHIGGKVHVSHNMLCISESKSEFSDSLGEGL
jgi:hypothetical protein